MRRNIGICSAPSAVNLLVLSEKENDEKKGEERKEELKKKRGENGKDGGEDRRRQMGKKDKCGKTRGKRELKGEGEEMEG